MLTLRHLINIQVGAALTVVWGIGRSVLTGELAWRPACLLAAADYAEIELDAPNLSARRAMWQAEIPELEAGDAEEMAARLRFGRDDVSASVRMARSAAEIAGEPSASCRCSVRPHRCRAAVAASSPR